MKKTVAIFLTLLYLAILFKPLFPHIEYAVRKDYITNTLCINKNRPEMGCEGRCYLNKQLTKEANTRDELPVTPLEDKTGSISLHIPVAFYYSYFSESGIHHVDHITASNYWVFQTPLSPPPRIVFS